MTRDAILKLISKKLPLQDLEKTRKLLKANYNISYGKYNPSEIRDNISAARPVIVEDKIIIGHDEGLFLDSEHEYFPIERPVNAIIVNDEMNEPAPMPVEGEAFAILGKVEWDEISDFQSVISPLFLGNVFVPPHSAVFNFLNPTGKTEKEHEMSSLTGVNINVYDKEDYIGNCFHEMGHLYWRTVLNYNEKQKFKALFDTLNPSAIYEFEWEKKDEEEVFCTIYKWFLKSLFINKSFRNILEHEEERGLSLLEDVFSRVREDKIVEDAWELSKEELVRFFNPKYDKTSSSFIRVKGAFESVKDIELPSSVLKDVESVQEGTRYVRLTKTRVVPVLGNKIDYSKFDISNMSDMKKARPLSYRGKELIFFDMDGVVADIAKTYRALFDRDIFKDDQFTIRQMILSVDHFWRSLPVLEKGRELFNELKKDYAIAFLTTPMDSVENCKNDKIEWAAEFFPEATTIIFSNNKSEYATSNQCLLIDDYGKNVDEFTAAGGVGINFKLANVEIIKKVKAALDPGDDIADIKARLKKLNNVERMPTDLQKESGNYKKGKVHFRGLDLVIENPKDSIRSGIGAYGMKWVSRMKAHYGYIDMGKDVLGADGDKVDFFLGENLKTNKVFVINQGKNGLFDEAKVMLGFGDAASARATYLSCYEKGWEKNIMSIVQTNIPQLKSWLTTRNASLPFGDKLPDEKPIEEPKAEMEKASFLDMMKSHVTKYIRREKGSNGKWKYIYTENKGKDHKDQEPTRAQSSSVDIIKHEGDKNKITSYDIMHMGKKIGWFGGMESYKGYFDLVQTEISDTDNRGKGLFQAAIQKLANHYPNGVHSEDFQTSKALKGALRKMETYSFENDSHVIRPKA